MKQKSKKIGNFTIRMQQILGSGSFGTIHKAYKDKNYNQPFACKIIQKSNIEKVYKLDIQYFIGRIREQYKALQSLKHNNIVEMFDVEETSNNLYLFFQFCQQDMENYIQHHLFNIIKEQVIAFSRQIIEACHYFTSKGYLHRDIKPANILIKNKNVKIADFGLAKQIIDKQGSVTFAGSPHYMAPQLLKGQALKLKDISKCDVWSVGITLYELANGYLPFGLIKKDLSDQKILQKIRGKQLQIKIEWCEWLQNIIKKMLVIDPQKRITFQQANILFKYE